MRAVTRRGLLGLGAALIAGAGGAAAGWVFAPERPAPAPPPAKRAPVLEAELARERVLLDRLTATAVARPALAGRVEVLRADHIRHVEALESLVLAAGVSLTSTSSPAVSSSATLSSSSSPDPLPSLAALRAAEATAGAAAARASLTLSGTAATTLASISASESTHAAWLS